MSGAYGGLFEAYEAPTDEENDELAHMLGEDVSGERSCIGVQRKPFVASFSINPPFTIPPAVYHDACYLEPVFGVLSSFITLFYFFLWICIDHVRALGARNFLRRGQEWSVEVAARLTIAFLRASRN